MRERIDSFNPPKPQTPLKASSKRLAVLSAFEHFQILRTDYLQHWAHCSTRAITELNKGWCIGVPHNEAIRTEGARNRDHLWEIRDRGRAMLAKPTIVDGDHIKHKITRSHFLYSFLIAPKEIPNLILRTPDEVLARAPQATQDAETPFRIPLPGYPIKKHNGDPVELVPDSKIMGYEYTQPDGWKRHFFFVMEVDNATETADPTDQDTSKNLARMIRQYAYAFEHGLFHDRYGIENITVLIYAKGEGRARTVLDLIRKYAPDYSEFFAVKAFKTIPPPSAHAITEPWQQVDGTLSIMEILQTQRT